MSAFMVSIEHIRVMINAGLNLRYPLSWLRVPLTAEQRERAYQRGAPWGPEAIEIGEQMRSDLTPETAERVGVMLMAQNRRSVDYRYNETEIEELYTHAPTPPRSIVEVLSAIDCYEYQSCETPDWEDTEAHRFCQRLRIALTHELPGWREAPWGIEAP